MTQLALFETPRRLGRDIAWDLAFSKGVESAVLAIFESRPDDWLDWADFKKIIEKNKIGFCFGHVLFQLSKRGTIMRKDIYFGSDHPGKPNFLGSKSVYMFQKGCIA